jgi:hypothetical protein
MASAGPFNRSIGHPALKSRKTQKYPFSRPRLHNAGDYKLLHSAKQCYAQSVTQRSIIGADPGSDPSVRNRGTAGEGPTR